MQDFAFPNDGFAEAAVASRSPNKWLVPNPKDAIAPICNACRRLQELCFQA